MKKFFWLALIFLAVGAGCSTTPATEENSSLESTSDEEASLVGGQSFAVLGLSMTLPDKYALQKIDGAKVFIKTDDTDHNVSLILDAKEIGLEEYYEMDSPSDPEIVLAEGEIFSQGCGGALACYLGRVEDRAFTFDWTVQSDQEPPADLDGVWAPDTLVTKEDAAAVLQTIEVVL